MKGEIINEEQAKDLYRNDPLFHQLVDMMTDLLMKGNYSTVELRMAASLAINEAAYLDMIYKPRLGISEKGYAVCYDCLKPIVKTDGAHYQCESCKHKFDIAEVMSIIQFGQQIKVVPAAEHERT